MCFRQQVSANILIVLEIAKNTPKLYTIKTKPIVSYRVNIHTKKTFRD
jgi:hypothetical protein